MNNTDRTINNMAKPITQAEAEEAKKQIKKYAKQPFFVGSIVCVLSSVAAILALIFSIFVESTMPGIFEVLGVILLTVLGFAVIKMIRIITNFGKNAKPYNYDPDPERYSTLRWLTNNFVGYVRPANKSAIVVFFIILVINSLPAFLVFKYEIFDLVGIFLPIIYVLISVIGAFFISFSAAVLWGLGIPKAWRIATGKEVVIVFNWIFMCILFALFFLIAMISSIYIIIKASKDIIEMDKICKRGY